MEARAYEAFVCLCDTFLRCCMLESVWLDNGGGGRECGRCMVFLGKTKVREAGGKAGERKRMVE